jgi:hypothetical protein
MNAEELIAQINNPDNLSGDDDDKYGNSSTEVLIGTGGASLEIKGVYYYQGAIYIEAKEDK